jgi:Membrane proteins related to metalloendopeptidases
MEKKKLKPYVIQGIYVLAVVSTILTAVLLTNSLDLATKLIEDDYIYVSYEILSDDIQAVIGEKKDDIKIARPYNEEGINILKSFYDYTKSKEDNKDAIIYYENTYLQNNGIDYGKEKAFNILAILPGKVISVTEDEITGKTIKIEHENNIISVYQSLSETKVKVDDTIKQGDLIGISGSNAIGSDLGNHLHFELIKNNIYVNPEEYFGKSLKEI